MSYLVHRPPHLEQHRIRGLDFQFYRWPGTDPQPILLLHGWGDSGATWQFVVDALPQRHTLIAFDARGFGRTQWPQDGYWSADYLADLDAVVDSLAPHAPIDLVGHSMGANIALLYGGIRPQRVRRLVSLEGFGLERTTPDQAPERYRQWLDEIRQGTSFSTYDDLAQLVGVLARRNPRTPGDRLEFIARAWSRENEAGRIELRADPRHKRVNAMLYQRDQAQACWQEILAPVLFVTGDASPYLLRMGEEIAPHRLHSQFRHLTLATIASAGHMLHHEQPAAVAKLIEDFLQLSG